MESTLRLRNILTLAFVISGTASLFLVKMQNNQWVDEGGRRKRFFHPYMQCLMMFVGEALCIIVFAIMQARNTKQYQEEAKMAQDKGKPAAPSRLIIVPAVLDFITSCLQYVALNFIPASVYQMLKGGAIITTFMFSYWLVGGVIKRSQLLGCVFALVGILMVGLTTVLFNHPESAFSTEDITIGTILMVASLFTNGFLFAFEQRIFHMYHITPVYMIGLEGVYGTIVSGIAVVGLTFIPCAFGETACAFGPDGRPYMQRVDQYFIEVIKSPILVSVVLVKVFVIAFFNVTGLMITKHINALARAILNMSKTALVWIIGIIVTVTAGKSNSDYKWELVTWEALVMQSFGFGFLVFGTLVYNENITLQCLNGPQRSPLLKEAQNWE